MIPSVASAISVDIIPNTSEVFLGQSVLACLPPFTVPFEETRRFNWNVENLIHKTMSFTYYVGEGPLYWYRIDWYPSICPPNPCIEMGPTIQHINPNCPYEIIEECIILPPCNGCTLSCIPGSCISQTVEVWHMLATSVIHLCERINQECCYRKPPGYMRRVRQYMRPALCCDVAKIGAIDEYVDVDFLKCECGNLIDPCVAVIIYPCHVNRCGIHGPVFSGGPVPSMSVIKMAPDLLGHMPMAIAQEVSALPVAVQIVSPKEIQPINRIVSKYGSSVPELIHCNHNLSEVNLFKEFLKLNKLKFDTLDLFHNKGTNSWHGSKVFKEWKVAIEWALSQDSERNYKLNISFDKNKIKSKISLFIKNEKFINDRGKFDIQCNFNASSGVLYSKNAVLQSKLIKDDIGLFKNLKNDLQLILRG